MIIDAGHVGKRGLRVDVVEPVEASASDLSIAPDIGMAGSWYQKAKDLGSAEAQARWIQRGASADARTNGVPGASAPRTIAHRCGGIHDAPVI